MEFVCVCCELIRVEVGIMAYADHIFLMGQHKIRLTFTFAFERRNVELGLDGGHFE